MVLYKIISQNSLEELRKNGEKFQDCVLNLTLNVLVLFESSYTLNGDKKLCVHFLKQTFKTQNPITIFNSVLRH